MQKCFLFSIFLGLLASCINEEPKNTECDIEAVSVHVENPIEIFHHEYDTLKVVGSASDQIVFLIRSHENVSHLPLNLRITLGATAYIQESDGTFTEFKNGSLVDFSGEKVQMFRIVSEDKQWNRTYSITFEHDYPTEGDFTIDFEDYNLDATGRFYEWSINDPNVASVFTDGKWKNGNPGYKLSKSSAKPMEYPSVPIINGGPDGSTCVKLETKDTGSFGNMVNMRLASGSMFNGVFDVSNALKDALKATRFGSPFAHKPVKLTAWLKFEPGAVFQDRKGNPVEGIVDEPDAYVVFYRNQDESGNEVMIDGNDMFTNPHIVGLGRLPHNVNEDGSDKLCNTPIHGLTSEWQFVEIPVIYTSEVDQTILANKGYSLAISFASSWQGGYFQGAIGNKLFVDNVSIYCDKDLYTDK
ncbi:MAG: PCMD domain-containing protein [Bacteroidaceae bacterium]|nr:PCMD domain-containing protein [Bacteroidaceae bacterium]